MDTLRRLLFLAAMLELWMPTLADAQGPTQVDFGRDIRPILSDTCFKCHGPDEHDRQAGLRLDTKESVFEEFETVVPGDLDSSELYQRLISDDVDLLMPPPDSGRSLSDEQKSLFKRWIEQGAEWEQHWSFVKPTSAALPSVQQEEWPVNSIDYFILSRLEEEQLTPTQPASRATLIRRVCFDLIGLPPSSELLGRYQNLKDYNWYEQLVDELFESEQYGEHMARFWLDAARYGDTHGLHLDNYREMWLYRDWVINAFNQNQSFKDFTIEQLAGDMLPNATDAQKIASGFNRAHVTTSEGGSIEEEVYVRNVIDRVSTTGTVFLGLTIGCAQCHDHKFDPISQTEFYQLFAFFNNMADEPMDKNIKDPQPVLMVANEEQEASQKGLEKNLAAIKLNLETMLAEYEYVDTDAESQDESGTDDITKNSKPIEKFVWVDDEIPSGGKPEQKWEFVSKGENPVQSGASSRVAQSRDQMVQHFFTGAAPLRVQSGDRFFANVYLDPENPPAEIMLQFNDGNWDHRMYWGEDKIGWGQNGQPSRYYAGELPKSGKWVELEIPVEQVGFKQLSLVNGMAFTQWGGKAYWDSAGVFTLLDQAAEFTSLSRWLSMARSTKGAGLPGPIKKLVQMPISKHNEKQLQEIKNYFLQNIHPDARNEFNEPIERRDEFAKQLEQLKKSIPTTLVSRENDEIKPAFFLNRGEYDQKGEQVERATPAALPSFPDQEPKNRLGFAHWLVSSKNPLMARVTVNRFWQQVFGTGIVKTAGDFGSQGDVPSHPELLDWLAIDFAENEWDVKRLMKSIVMSSTYQQSSRVTPELIAKDPDNRLLARGPRFRLDAETLRDQALAVSGLLVPTIGGPSVKPPQPSGLWFVVGYSGSNTVRFKKDDGHDKVHRRSLYTFWKRTAPPPQMNTFDAPSREACSVRRERTNTPLQALLLMNDPQYIEAARFLAQETLDADTDHNIRLRFIFETALGRLPNDNETGTLSNQLKLDENEFRKDPDAAKRLIAIGEQVADEKYDPVELASWTMMASLIMNMDEFINKN